MTDRNIITLTDHDVAAVNTIAGKVPGWSMHAHYAFFKTMLEAHPEKNKWLMLGVYHGRDICFIMDLLARYYPQRSLTLVGIDKFEDAPCADWTAEQKKGDWAAAGFGPPPSMEAARRNIGFRADNVTLVKRDDESFLRETGQQFDFLYLDTSHDEQSVLRQLQQVRRLALPGAVIAGDDYADTETWGVRKAVGAAFTSHAVFADWIWYSTINLLHP